MKRQFFSSIAALLLVFGFTLNAAAAEKIRLYGQVHSVDQAKAEFVVKDMQGATHTFKVDQRSEFELDGGKDKKDQKIPFSALKPGDEVRVKAYGPLKDGDLPLADDVDIRRR